MLALLVPDEVDAPVFDDSSFSKLLIVNLKVDALVLVAEEVFALLWWRVFAA